MSEVHRAVIPASAARKLARALPGLRTYFGKDETSGGPNAVTLVADQDLMLDLDDQELTVTLVGHRPATISRDDVVMWE